jgi:hypothetical protein
MENVKVIIDHFDENTNSLIVSFSCLLGDREVKTSTYAFQTHHYNTTNLQEIIDKLAIVGHSYLGQEIQKLKHSENNQFIDQLKNLKNTEFEVSVNNILPPSPVNNGVIVDNLEVII